MPENAVADTPPQTTETEVIITPDPLATNIGDVFKQALAKEQGTTEETKPAKEAPQKPAKGAKAAEKDKEAAKEEKAPQKPASALDAAIETGKPEAKTDDEPAKDPLEEFPEDDKKPNWKRAREVIRDVTTKAGTLEKELAETRQQLQVVQESAKKGDPAMSKQLETVLAENAQLKDAITAVNVELLPEFRAEFIEGRNALVKSAGEKLKAYGGNPEALTKALAMPEGRMRDDAIEAAFGDDITPTGRTKILQVVAQIEEKDAKRAEMLADPQHTFEAFEQKQSATRQKAAEAAEAQRQSQFEKIAKTMPEKSPFFRTVDATVPGAEEWNAGVESARETALRLLKPGAAEFDETALIALKGGRYDAVEKMLLDTRAELLAAKQQLAEFDTAQPDAKGGKPPPKTDAQAKLEKTPGQIYAEEMAKGGGSVD